LCFTDKKFYVILIGCLLIASGFFYFALGLCYMKEESQQQEQQQGSINEVKVINPHEKPNINIPAQ